MAVEPPERVYLQIPEEGWDHTVETTWCQDRINETDVPYVLESVVARLSRSNRELEGQIKQESKAHYELRMRDLSEIRTLKEQIETAREELRESLVQTSYSLVMAQFINKALAALACKTCKGTKRENQQMIAGELTGYGQPCPSCGGEQG